MAKLQQNKEASQAAPLAPLLHLEVTEACHPVKLSSLPRIPLSTWRTPLPLMFLNRHVWSELLGVLVKMQIPVPHLHKLFHTRSGVGA